MSASSRSGGPTRVRLYLLRHGPAGLKSAWEGDDVDRPLTAKGVRRIEQIAQALAVEELEPDLVLTSPFARADQTARIVAERLGNADVTFVDERLSPGFAIDQLCAILDDRPDAEALLLVGHEPDLSTLTEALCGARVALQKGGLIELELERPHVKEATLVRVEQPGHLLRSLAPQP